MGVTSDRLVLLFIPIVYCRFYLPLDDGILTTYCVAKKYLVIRETILSDMKADVIFLPLFFFCIGIECCNMMVYFILKNIFWKVQSKERQLLLFPFLCSKCSFSFLLQCVIWWSISQLYLKQKCCWKSTKQRKTTIVISILLFEVLFFFSFFFTPHDTM